jgi:glycosyltransferase involved in cell wall biosynthesis
MKILLNMASCASAGALARACRFLRFLSREKMGHEWTIVVSREVEAFLDDVTKSATTDRIVLGPRPGTNARTRKKLKSIEARVSPDCVFTFAGPAYVGFQGPHLLGCFNAWVFLPSWLAYRQLASPWAWAKTAAVCLYHRLWYRNATAWVTQTTAVRDGIAKTLRVPPIRIGVVPNTASETYVDLNEQSTPFSPGNKLRLLYLTAPYPHKRLAWIPEVARKLSEAAPELDFEFVVTLPTDHPIVGRIERAATRLGVQDRIFNFGRVSIADSPELYRTCDISFVPTVLETFSANYPEAMAMGLPIVTTDADFSRSICRNAALYFDPESSDDAAAKILQLIRQPELWKSLVERGKNVLATLPTPIEEFRSYVNAIEKTAAGQSLETWHAA